LVHFSGFGIMCQEKSGNPGHDALKKHFSSSSSLPGVKSDAGQSLLKGKLSPE
jgi:hypothetical protein